MTFKKKTTSALALAAISLLATIPDAFALDTWEFKTGKGESVLVKKGLFGTKTVRVQDRLGNGYESDKSFLGKKKNSVSVFGNGVSVEKNIFGQTNFSGASILGDKIQSKRSWFGLGPRRTSVDISGVTSLAEQLIGKKAPGGVLPNTQPPSSRSYSDIGLGSDPNASQATDPAKVPQLPPDGN